jgi:hypothetical protein
LKFYGDKALLPPGSDVVRESLGFWSVCGLPEPALNRGPSASDQLEDQSNQSQHQQDVDKSTHGVAANHAQQPENKQNYK